MTSRSSGPGSEILDWVGLDLADALKAAAPSWSLSLAYEVHSEGKTETRPTMENPFRCFIRA
jgi:hypothetical protein